MWRDLLLLLTAFLAGTGVAEAVGTANLGTSATFGTLAFTAAMMFVLLKR